MAIVEKYDKTSLFPMFLIYFHHLHPLYEAESSFAYKIDEDLHPLYEAESSFAYKFDEDRSLDIFWMAANVNMPTKDLVN